MKVSDIMSRDLKVSHSGASIAAAAAIMWDGDCGFVPVLDSRGRTVGVITDRDICIAAGTRMHPASEVPVDDVMSREIHACAPADDIRVALRTMADRQVRRLAVVNPDGSLAGVLSLNDIVRFAEPVVAGRKPPDLTWDTLASALKSICKHRR